MRLICRVCLLVDFRVFECSMELLSFFQEVIWEEKFQIEDCIFQNAKFGLCVDCKAILLRWRKFRIRCLDTAIILKTLVQEGKNTVGDIELVCKEDSSIKCNKTDLFNFECSDQKISKILNESNYLWNQKTDRCVEKKQNVIFLSEKDSIEVASRLSIDAIQTQPDEVTVDDAFKMEHSDGFDSDDDKALIKLDIFSKEDSLCKPFSHKTRKKKQEKIDQQKCVMERELDDSTGLKTKMGNTKPERDENIEGGGASNEKVRHRRRVFYRLAESHVQMKKQSIDEIKKELETFREMDGYQAAPYKCEPCAKYFMTDISISLHRGRHLETAGPLICDICTQRYNTHRSLLTHVQTHTDRYKCVFAANVNKRNNGENSGEILNTDANHMCGRLFSTRSAAIKHSLKHTGTQMLFHCHICGKTTNCADMHQKHVRSHTRLKKYQCPQCDREFRNSTARNLHFVRVHTSERHFSCPSCPMTFVNKTALVAHSIKHSSHREFYCVECDMRFKSASILKCHLATSAKHSDPNTFKFQCSMCPKRYPFHHRLRDHIESTHSRQGHHVCEMCRATYHTAAGLRKHRRQKHQNTPKERKHKCLICNKAFLTRQTLASHQLIHTGELPFSCQTCGRPFRHKAALWTHNKLVHNRTKSSTKDDF